MFYKKLIQFIVPFVGIKHASTERANTRATLKINGGLGTANAYAISDGMKALVDGPLTTIGSAREMGGVFFAFDGIRSLDLFFPMLWGGGGELLNCFW